MSRSGTQKPATTIRVERDVYEELIRRQRVFREEHGGTISISVIIERLMDAQPVIRQALADRKQATP